jgi:predicted transcriptional regulator of viral defense system
LSEHGRDHATANVLLGRLVEDGALYRVRKGEYAYTAPRFRDHLLRRAGR